VAKAGVPVVPAPAAAATAPVPVPAAPSAARDSLTQARTAIDAWAQAWSRQDVNAYVATYASDFAPPGLSRSAWIDMRRKQILGPKSISIGVDNLRATAQGDTVVAEFDQIRRADGAVIRSRKTLELVKTGSHWLITKEVNRF
jgi:ketosteroid isomerase-like protein